MDPKLFNEVEEKLRLADYLMSQSSENYLTGAAQHLLRASNSLLKEILQTEKLSPQLVASKLESHSDIEKEFASHYMRLWKTCSEKNPKKQTLIEIHNKIKEVNKTLKEKHYVALEES